MVKKSIHQKVCARLFFFFLIKYIITNEFTEIQRVLSTLTDINFCHTIYSSELLTFTKVLNAEVALRSIESTRNRKESVVLGLECNLLA